MKKLGTRFRRQHSFSEVYLRLINVDRMTTEGRAHFLAVAARLMRQILVDNARRRRAGKRGGGVTIVGLDEAASATWRSECLKN